MAFPGMAAMLGLADQRLPAGGHVHSGGVEQAVTDGLVHDSHTLAGFLDRRLDTAGRVGAGLTAAALDLTTDGVRHLDAQADARMPSGASRAASRAQGRGLRRLAAVIWPAPHAGVTWAALGSRPHHAVVLGCAARAAGLDAAGAALVAAYLAVTGPATAAQRLLALDPLEVAAVTMRLGPRIEAVAAQVVRELPGSPRDWDLLPDDGDPLLDLLAERHAGRDDRLFAS